MPALPFLSLLPLRTATRKAIVSMSLAARLADSLERSFARYRDLIAEVGEPALSSKLPGLPSNTLGLQLWCVVGGRESYAAALKVGRWSGYACSLEEPTCLAKVEAALRESETAVRDALQTLDAFSEAQNGLLIDLLEHEAAHQGQLIRYLYGLRLPIPASWKARYALR